MPRKDRALMEQCYTEIKRRIITLELPPGARIDANELGMELELSRTPIREASFRLAAEGLVDTPTRVGFVVRAIDLINITHLFEAHLVIAKAIGCLTPIRVTAAQLDAMRAITEEIRVAIEARDYLAITSRNAYLHRLEAEAAGNTHLQAMAESILDHGQRLAYLCFGGAGGERTPHLDTHFSRVLADHDAMLAAMEARDSEAGQRIATSHVHLFRDRVQAFLRPSGLDDFTLSELEIPVAPFQI
jgi:DNA-binding GntR family transcriptional regulator